LKYLVKSIVKLSKLILNAVLIIYDQVINIFYSLRRYSIFYGPLFSLICRQYTWLLVNNKTFGLLRILNTLFAHFILFIHELEKLSSVMRYIVLYLWLMQASCKSITFNTTKNNKRDSQSTKINFAHIRFSLHDFLI